MAKAKAKLDLVLFGAAGYTGKLVAKYLARRGGRKPRWALAGRSLAQLEVVRDRLSRLDPALDDLPLIEADASDPEAMRRLAASARVIASCVGPYIFHGEQLVAACADAGTHYVDLCSEPEFVDLMWLRYHDRAKASGAFIVNCCGFDSLPHDLGVLHTVQQLPEGVPIRVESYVRMHGRLSGGSMSTAAITLSRWRQMNEVRAERRRREGRPVDRRIGSSIGRPRFDRLLNTWVVPMPTVVPQVVLRSAAASERYGSEFHYGHYLQIKDLAMLAEVGGRFAALAITAQLAPMRQRLARLAGRGPSDGELEAGWFSVRFAGTGGGRTVYAEVCGGDPGYIEAAKMLAESALCLAFDRLPLRPGVRTPAHVMGAPLTRRLQASGIVFRDLESLAPEAAA